ncbi:MAG: YgaP family membrane protein [Bacillota bacterium]
MPTRSRVGTGNVSGTGFTVRVVVGLILLALVVFRFVLGFWAGVFVTAAVVMFTTAFTRTCPLTSAWHLWFSGGGGSPAPKRMTGGGPGPQSERGREQQGREQGGQGPSTEKRGAPGAESFSGSSKHQGDGDKDH